MQIRCLAMAIILSQCLTATAQTFETISIVPQPSIMVDGHGIFKLTSSTSIIAPVAKSEANLLRDSLRPATGFGFEVLDNGDKKRAIELELVTNNSALPEGSYTLDVTADGVKIASATAAGLFYGTQTLRQLLPAAIFSPTLVNGVQWSIPLVHIEDQPRFPWRGMMLDCSRHFFPPADVKQFIDLLALHKMNHFHWHLTDDQGWRIEIKKYPKLTSVGSKRAGSSVFDPTHPKVLKLDGVPYSGFYTQDEIRDVVAYATARHVTIVPEIEMPGHSAAAIAAYPELGVTGQQIQVRTAWGVEKHILRPNDATIAFYKEVLTEVMDLFPSDVIHLGGDEAPKEEWNNDPQIKAQIVSLGLPNADALQAWYIGQMSQFLAAHGRHLIGWDEILQGGLAPGAVVMSWHGTKGAAQAAALGHETVNTSNTAMYFDYYQSKDQSHEPKAIGGFIPLSRVYAFDPMPAGLLPEQQRYILGAQAQIWTEYLSTTAGVQYMAYPRGCALAEDDWSDPKLKNYDQFLTRLKIHLERLKAMSVNFRPLDEPTTTKPADK